MTVAQLDYAPGAPVRRRKLLGRMVLLAAVVVVGAWMAVWARDISAGSGALLSAAVSEI